MTKKKAQSVRDLSHRVQLTTMSLAPVFDVEAVLDELTVALGKVRALTGLSTSADLLLRRIYVTTIVDGQGTVDTAGRFVMDAWSKAVRDLDSRPGGWTFDVAELLVERMLDPEEEDRQELLGTPEVAERLGVSRERVRQWASEPGRFPTPAARIRDTHVWRWGDIADWLALGGRRRTGRPKKHVEPNEVLELPKIYLGSIGRAAAKDKTA